MNTDGGAQRDGSSGPRPSGWSLVAPLAIVPATLLAYAGSFGASFHFDDYVNIVQNERLRSLSNLWPPSGSRWLGELTFALNYRLGGLAVGGYHAVNVAVHVAAALLVAALAAVTLRTPAARGRTSPLVRDHLPLAAGLLFALHPLATQSVTYVVQRFASLATLFYVLALGLYARARLRREAEGRATASGVALAILSVVSAALAMETKEIAVTLPIVVAGYELLFFRPPRRLGLLAPLAATAALPLLDPTLGGRLASATLSRGDYLLTQTRVVATYLRLLVWPAGQNLDHDVPISRSLAEPAVLLSLALLLAVALLAGWLVVQARRSGSAEGLLAGGGIAWFFVTLSVESSVIPIQDVIFEHRTYLPSVGAAIAVATALLLAVSRLRLQVAPAAAAVGATLLLAAPLGVATHLRNRVWQDEVTLWSDVVSKSPRKARAHLSLGEALAQRGEQDAAIAEYLVALQLHPDYLEALYNLGNSYLAQRRLSEAMVAFTLATRADPKHAMSHNNLGAVLQRLGNLPGAAAEYREALRLDPGLALARGNLRRLGEGEP